MLAHWQRKNERIRFCRADGGSPPTKLVRDFFKCRVDPESFLYTKWKMVALEFPRTTVVKRNIFHIIP